MYGGGGGRAERPAWAPQIYPEPHLRLWRHAGPRLSLTLPLYPSKLAPPSPTPGPPPPSPHSPLTLQALELIASQDQGPQSRTRGSHSWHQTQVVIGDVQMVELRQVLRGGGDKDSLLDQTLARLL